MLRVFFIGRRSIFEELRNMVIEGDVIYADMPSSINRAGVIFIVDYYVNSRCVGCIRLSGNEDPIDLLVILINSASLTLNRERMVMGLDYGDERIGLILVYDNRPILGKVLSKDSLNRVIGSIKLKIGGIAIGSLPRFSEITKLCRITSKVFIVDEEESSKIKSWVSDVGLSGDVADAYAIVLTKPKITVMCP